MSEHNLTIIDVHSKDEVIKVDTFLVLRTICTHEEDDFPAVLPNTSAVFLTLSHKTKIVNHCLSYPGEFARIEKLLDKFDYDLVAQEINAEEALDVILALANDKGYWVESSLQLFSMLKSVERQQTYAEENTPYLM